MKIRLLTALGLEEREPWVTVLVVIAFLMGLAIFTDGVAEFAQESMSLGLLATGAILWIFSIAIYGGANYLHKKRLSAKTAPLRASEKEYVIAILPRRELQEQFERYYTPRRCFYIRDKKTPFPLTDNKNWLDEIDDMDVPEQIVDVFETIMKEIKASDIHLDKVIVEVTSGKTFASITLFKLAEHYGLEVGYLSGPYRGEGKIVPDGEAKALTLSFTREIIGKR